MKINLLKIVALLIGFASFVNANAYDISQNGIYYNITSSSSLEVAVTHDFTGLGNIYGSSKTHNIGYTGVVNIPSTINYNNRTYRVTSIDEYAFGGSQSGCEITQVTIPSSVTSIGQYAFSNCAKLTRVTGAEGVRNIEEYAFNRCTSLSSFTFGPSLVSIGTNGFYNTGFKSLQLGDSLEYLGRYAFSLCNDLTYVIMGDCSITLDSYTFYNCPKLTTIYFRSNIKPTLGTSSFDRTGVKSYVPSSQLYGFGTDYLYFYEYSYPYSGVANDIVWSNNVENTLCTVTGNFTEKNAGDYTALLKANYTGSVNFTVNVPYSYSITKAPLIVTVENKTRKYGENNPTFTSQANGLVNGETLGNIGTVNYQCVATPRSEVGTYPIYVQIYAPNYDISYVYGNLTVDPAILSVSTDNVQRRYGEANPAFALYYIGFVNMENENNLIQKPTARTSATRTSPVGEYDITISGGMSKNYTFEYYPGKLTIVPASLTVRANNVTRPYGDQNPQLKLSYTGFVNGESEKNLAKAPVAQTSANQYSPVGEYDITISPATANNYSIEYIPGILTVTKALLTVKAPNITRSFGEENPQFELQYSGFKNYENPDVLAELPVAFTEATQESNPGEYPIHVSGGEAENYSFDYVDGLLKILAEGESGLDYVSDELIEFEIRDNAIYLINKPANQTCYLFDLSGNKIAETNKSVIKDLATGIYILSIGGKSYKIKI